MNEKEIQWPADITFKAVFRNKKDVVTAISAILEKNNLDAVISSKKSRNAKFISYTITATFPADSELQQVCNEICQVEGYMTLF